MFIFSKVLTVPSKELNMFMNLLVKDIFWTVFSAKSADLAASLEPLTALPPAPNDKASPAAQKEKKAASVPALLQSPRLIFLFRLRKSYISPAIGAIPAAAIEAP